MAANASVSIATSWNSNAWLTTAKPHTSLKKTIQAYKAISQKLQTKLNQLTQRREELGSLAFIVVDEITPAGRATATATPATRPSLVPGPRSPVAPPTAPPINSASPEIQPAPARLAENDYHHSDLTSLACTVTRIVIESVEIRLAYVNEALDYLGSLYHDNPKQRTPPELMLSRYDEWVQTNQRLFELNSRLYDLEKIKFELQRRENGEQEIAQKSSRDREEFDHTASQMVKGNATKIQSFLSRYQFPSPASSMTQTYLQEVLTRRGDRITLEAQKLQEYVNECIQNSQVALETMAGAHPESYQQFMAVLCNFMVERQREVQGEELPHSMVFSTVEHVLVPQIQSQLLRYVQQRERDVLIKENCERFSGITMRQLNIKPAYWSPELEPFLDSIAQLRATYFSPTPTDKMSAVVAAAKALYDQLSTMGEDSIDGDSFLDIWVYVTIKANIPDLATNIEFMSLYGNPTLGMDEAGYYLTTLCVAANFIEQKLNEEDLKKPNHPESFVVCERDKFCLLSETAGSCFQVVSEREELRGYRVAVVKDWVLNKAKLFCCVLLHTGDPSDTAAVSVIEISAQGSSPQTVEYFASKLTKPQEEMEGLASQTTPLGHAITLDLERIEKGSYFILRDEDFDACSSQIQHVIQLIRLGSESIEQSCDSQQDRPRILSEDSDFIYVVPPQEEDLGESLQSTHRVLVQNLKPEEKRSKLGILSPTKVKSKSFAGAAGEEPSKGYISVSRSPGEISLDSLPPGTPTEGDRDRENKTRPHVSWGVSKMMSSGSEGNLDEQIPKVNTETVTSDDERDYASSTKQSHKLLPVEIENYDVNSMSILSDMGPEGAESIFDERLVRSDNSSLDTAKILDAGRSSGLGKLKTSFRDRFSLQKKRSRMRSGLHQSTNLTVPLLRPRRESGGTKERSKVRSRTSAEEERYVKPRERGRGSFVIVKVRDPGPEEFLGGKYVRKLEENFRLNHLFGSLVVDVEDKMRTIIKQGQMYLQHLNYLSVAVQIDSTFSNVAKSSVRMFQRSHNKLHSSFSSSLIEDGHLTYVTFQYLRQEFLTAYANIARLGHLSSLGDAFDPTCTEEEDIQAFRTSISKFQDLYGLQCQHKGLLCQHTIQLINTNLARHYSHSLSQGH